MDSSAAGMRRYKAFERVLAILSPHRLIPSTKVPALERELFIADLLAIFAERVAALDKRLEDLQARVSKLEPVVHKAPAKADDN